MNRSQGMSAANAWELAAWSAVETAERVRRKEVSAQEVLAAAIVRANDRAALNAVVTETYERAVRAIDAVPRGTFYGVPSAVKDLAQVAGVRTAWGSGGSGVYTSPKSDPWVRAFERTGLLSIGKTATPELGMTATTEPVAFGACRNPWDQTRTPGGSSGGAAALVAGGVLPIAHASDGGGSIRIPASCCGLVGLKVTRGRFDMEASPLLPVNVAVHGVVSRDVRDTAMFWQSLEGSHASRTLPPIGPVDSAPMRRLRVRLFTNSPGGSPVDREVREAVLRTGALCASLGHDVEERPCPFDGSVIDDFILFWGLLCWLQVRAGRLLVHPGFDGSKVEPFTLGFAEHFLRHKRATLEGLQRLRAFEREYLQAFASCDVWLGPTLAELPPKLGHLSSDVPFATALERLQSFTPFTALVNVAGAPAISLPLERSAEGLPLGMHFMARHGEERLLLELAAELEAAKPWSKFIAPT